MESMTKKDRIWLKLMHFGEKLGCHQMESRSFSYKGYQFPVCARCTGVILGQFSAMISLLFGLRLPIYAALIFIAVMGLDWGIQYLKIRESHKTDLRITLRFRPHIYIFLCDKVYCFINCKMIPGSIL